jgi:hypothetical protein
MPTSHLDDLRIRFHKELDEICEFFISSFGLSHSKDEAHLSSPLFRWMDFRLRYIDPIPRTIIYSDKFSTKLPIHIQRALNKLEVKIRMGEDINPYQSKGIISNDVSAKKKTNRTDRLWADWKIQHFHLTENDPPENDYFVPRSGWQLFAIIEGSEVFFIDALPHLKGSEYSDIELMETVRRCLPQYMERFELKGILSGTNPTKEELDQLRKAGGFRPLNIGGKVHMGPGRGITTAGTALDVTMKEDRVRVGIDALANYVCSPESDTQKHVIDKGIEDPEFHFSATHQGLGIVEAKSDHAFLLPRVTEKSSNPLAQLHDLLLPEGAAKFIASKLGLP